MQKQAGSGWTLNYDKTANKSLKEFILIRYQKTDKQQSINPVLLNVGKCKTQDRIYWYQSVGAVAITIHHRGM